MNGTRIQRSISHDQNYTRLKHSDWLKLKQIDLTCCDVLVGMAQWFETLIGSWHDGTTQH